MFKFVDEDGTKHLPAHVTGKLAISQCGARITIQPGTMTDEPDAGPHCPACEAKVKAQGGFSTSAPAARK